MKKLQLEFNSDFEATPEQLGTLGRGILITPAVGEDDYWLFRVKVSKTQSIIGFPKFRTIGIGFAKEKDWNTNLPYTSSASGIYSHIKHNKACTATDADCLKAIKMVQEAATKFLKEKAA